MIENLTIRHGSKNPHLLVVRDQQMKVLGTGDTLSGEMTISAQADPNLVWRALCSRPEWPADAIRPMFDDALDEALTQHRMT